MKAIVIASLQQIVGLKSALAVVAVAWIGGWVGLTVLPRGDGRVPPASVGYDPELVMAEGVVEGATPEVALRPEGAGTIVAIHVKENEEVTAGTLLLELRNDTQKQQVALAQAELDATRVQYQQAEAECRRAQRLGGTSAISGQDFDAQHYKKLLAQSRVAEADARLGLARAELAKTRLLAPSAGRILKVFARLGATGGPGNPQPVLILADLSRRHVRASVEELDVRRVKEGQRATVTADGFPGQEFHGTVKQVLWRMGKDAPRSDRPDEYRDVHFREVLIDLDGGRELPMNLRVQVRLAT